MSPDDLMRGMLSRFGAVCQGHPVLPNVRFRPNILNSHLAVVLDDDTAAMLIEAVNLKLRRVRHSSMWSISVEPTRISRSRLHPYRIMDKTYGLFDRDQHRLTLAPVSQFDVCVQFCVAVGETTLTYVVEEVKPEARKAK